MQCVVYKSQRKADTYLYVERENDFRRVPDGLLTMMGRLEPVMTLNLASRTNLAHHDPEEVSQQLTDKGYFLQLPPPDTITR